jgi:thiol-disulfide isomerase/thioredoxin
VRIEMTRTATIVFLTWLFLCGWNPTYAADNQSVDLADGTEVPLRHFPAADPRVTLLWLPSEFGLSPRLDATAEALADGGIEVWLADLHSAWFLPSGRYSLDEVTPAAIAELIDRVQQRSDRVLYVIAPGRTAALALQAIHQWQITRGRVDALGGLLMLHPKLYTETPQGGAEPDFIPVARASNTPVYLFQPEHSAHFWRIARVAEVLEEGGAPVFMHFLPGVSDGFNTRLETRPGEPEMTDRLPAMIDQAIRLLAGVGSVPDNAMPLPDSQAEAAAAQDQGGELLRPYPAQSPAPPLRLPDLDGKVTDLRDLVGQVVLVNFWATWCPPCVEEIPSLERLKTLREQQGLAVVTVDVGEEPAEIREFLADKPVSFPVLLDPDALAFAGWNVYAFPTTFLLDRQHRIRYAVFGALHWDSPEVLRTVDQLLGEPLPAARAD